MRARLLHDLRRESDACAEHRVRPDLDSTPHLAALVDECRKWPRARAIYLKGVRFPITDGWCRIVRCPDTGTALVGVSGGWLV